MEYKSNRKVIHCGYWPPRRYDVPCEKVHCQGCHAELCIQTANKKRAESEGMDILCCECYAETVELALANGEEIENRGALNHGKTRSEIAAMN